MKRTRTKTALAWAMNVFYLGGFLFCFMRWGPWWAILFALTTMLLYAFTYPYRNIR